MSLIEKEREKLYRRVRQKEKHYLEEEVGERNIRVKREREGGERNIR